MSKKGNCVYKRKDGRFEARYVKERDEFGRILKYGFVYAKTYREVVMKREIIIKNQNNNMKLLKNNFNDEILKWLDTKFSIKKSTYYNYYSIINSNILDYFDNKTLNKINKDLILNFIKYLQNKKLSPKRINDILILLKQFLKYKEIYIKFENPKVLRKKILTLNEKEIEIIEKNTLNTKNIKDFAILLTLFTGMRIGELCALQWKDIDFNNQIININKTLVRIKNKDIKNKTKIILDSPKTESSIRNIPLHNELVKKLKTFKSDNDYYVLTGNFLYITPQKYYIYYKNYLKSHKISSYNFHVLRHTFATRALLNGIDIKTLSEILGHSSVKITLDTYVHIKEKEKLEQINKIPIITK